VRLHFVFSSFYHLAFCKNSVPTLLLQCSVFSNEMFALTVPFLFFGVILIFVLFLFPLLCYADMGDSLLSPVPVRSPGFRAFLHVFLDPSEWSSQPGGHWEGGGGHGLRLQQV
jgi:hypothetical protein